MKFAKPVDRSMAAMLGIFHHHNNKNNASDDGVAVMNDEEENGHILNSTTSTNSDFGQPQDLSLSRRYETPQQPPPQVPQQQHTKHRRKTKPVIHAETTQNFIDDDDNDEETLSNLRCRYCDVLLLDERYLRRHLEDVHGLSVNDDFSATETRCDEKMGNIPCPECSKIFADSDGLRAHLFETHMRMNDEKERADRTDQNNRLSPDTVDNENNLTCPICNRNSSGENEFVAHLLREHNQDNAAAAVLYGLSSIMPAAAAALYGGLGPLENGREARREEDEETKNANVSPASSSTANNRQTFCELCNKEFSHKYFLDVHKANVHGADANSVEENAGPGKNTENGKGDERISENADQNGSRAQTPAMENSPNNALANAVDPSGLLDAANSFFQSPSAFDHLAAAGGQNLCPFCHQYFANSTVMQSHMVSAHASLLMNPAAMMYTASLMNGGNPFGQSPTSFLQSQQQQMANSRNGGDAQMAAMAAAAAAAMLGFGNGVTPALDPSAFGMDFFNQQQQAMQNPASWVQAFSSMDTGEQSPSARAAGSLFSNGSAQYGSHAASSASASAAQMETYCELCQKAFCNKYFLRKHKLNKHGIMDDSPTTQNGARNVLDQMKSPVSMVQCANGNNGQGKTSPKNLFDAVSSNAAGPTPAKFAKIKDDASQSLGSGSTAMGTFECNFCVKAFPSMFALVAHKYRDHGAYDGTPSPILANRLTENGSLLTSPVSKVLANLSQQQQLQPAHFGAKRQQTPTGNGPQPPQGVDPEAYCDICQKEVCSKYFLRTHKLNIHGIVSEPTGTSPGTGATTNAMSSNRPPANGSTPFGLTFGEKENGRPTAVAATPNGNPLLMMHGVGAALGRPLVASKNFCDICNKDVCNKYFLRTHMLKMHGIVIDENKTVIANINTLDKEKTGQLVFRCDLCGEQLGNRQQLRAHKQNVHQVVMPPTPVAGSGTTPDHTVGPMDATVSKPVSLTSSVADGSFLKRESIDSIGETVDDVSGTSASDHIPDEYLEVRRRLYSEYKDLCVYCGKRFKNSRGLRAHMLTEHQHQQMQLPLHAQLLQNQLQGPSEQDDSKMILACEYCPKRFADHADLQMHIIGEHQREVRGSVASMAEQAALDALTNNPAFQAAKNAAAETVLQQQQQQQSNEEKPSREPEKSTDLPLVARAKNGTKLYRCAYCNYYTRWISNLSTHEKRHNVNRPNGDHGDKPFKCRMCLRSYRYSHSLQRHMEVHRFATLGLQAAASAMSQQQQHQNHDNSLSDVVASVVDELKAEHDERARSSPPDEVLMETDQEKPDFNAKNDQEKMETFSPQNSPDKRHHCQRCGKAFGNRELYKMHVLTMHNTILASPPKQCNNVVQEQSQQPHQQHQNGGKKIFRCRLCNNYSSKVRADLREHLMSSHGIESAKKSQEKPMNFEVSNDKKMQKFRITEQTGLTGIFPAGTVVELPVLRPVDHSVEVTLRLRPISEHS